MSKQAEAKEVTLSKYRFEQVQNAEKFIKNVKAYLEQRYENN